MTDRDRGSASIWLLGCCALLLTVALVAALRSQAVYARHRAETAADLAALAAAGRIGTAGDSCSAARAVAESNGATLISCTPEPGADGRSGAVTVRVRVHARLAVVGDRTVDASARAGRGLAMP